MKNANITIIAEALADNRNYKNARIDGKTVGVKEFRAWSNAVKALRLPAYAIRQYRHANLGKAESVDSADRTALFNALHLVLELVGEVNGAKLNPKNIAEEIIAQASRIRIIDITEEMAEARCNKRVAKKAMNEDENEDTIKAYEEASEEVSRLESEPGNCKRLFEVQSESTFIKNIEVILGDAITKQTMKTAEEVAAEEEARRQARRARTAAKKAAKRAAAEAAAK